VKLKSFAHNELVKNYMLDEDYIFNKIKNNQDIFGRNIKLCKTNVDKNLKLFLLKNYNDYKKFII
jgi:hypothetical protein